ncbi:unnamed protein product [Phytophthora fragariaefolia]|uniref:Unnamed protein product n=1 Tax=Phytophthora fragariaefolia TaxID=1490495 RepID=A0A9W6Y9W7_9STRA|nr:unnamed protein product [Phytophthora fragariaefolia]
MDFAAHFMKLNSPPGSSIKSSAKKRKHMLGKADETGSDTEEKQEHNDDVEYATRPQRPSLIGKTRLLSRTYADESSDSGAELEFFLPRSSIPKPSHKVQLNVPAFAALPLHSAGTDPATEGVLDEEKNGEEQNEEPPKKRMASAGVTGNRSTHNKVRFQT